MTSVWMLNPVVGCVVSFLFGVQAQLLQLLYGNPDHGAVTLKSTDNACLLALGSRISISLTLLLTAVAFQFVVSESLPRIAYNTCLDYLFLVMYFMIGLSYLQNVIVFQLFRSGTSVSSLDAIDRTSAAAYACVWLVVAIIYYILLPWHFRAEAPLVLLPTVERLKKHGLELDDDVLAELAGDDDEA
jgi:hypothetical protein